MHDALTITNPYHHWLGLPRTLTKPTYYQLLGIKPTADESAIREATKKLLVRLASESGAPAPEKLSELKARIRRAEKTLRSQARRRAYDERLAAAVAAGHQQLTTETTMDMTNPLHASDTPTAGRSAGSEPAASGDAPGRFFARASAADIDPMAPFLPPGYRPPPSAPTPTPVPDAKVPDSGETRVLRAKSAEPPATDYSAPTPASTVAYIPSGNSGFHPISAEQPFPLGDEVADHTIDLTPLQPARPAPLETPQKASVVLPALASPSAASAGGQVASARPSASPVGVVQPPPLQSERAVVRPAKAARKASAGRRALARAKRPTTPWGFYLLGLAAIGAVFATLHSVLNQPRDSQVAETRDQSPLADLPPPPLGQEANSGAQPQDPPVADLPAAPVAGDWASGFGGGAEAQGDAWPSAVPEPAAPQPGSMDAPAPAPQTPSPASEAPAGKVRELSASDRGRVFDLLKQGRRALEQYDFETNKKHLNEARQLAANSPQQDLVERQLVLAQQTRRFQTLLLEQLRQQPPGTTYTLSATTQFILVEVAEDRLVVRVQGMNKRYPIQPLPRGIGVALAHGILDDSAGSKVLLGAFLASHPDRDQLDEKQALEYWRQAEAGGIDLHGIQQVLSDSYDE